jgi:predicted dehydrogenase
MQAPSRRFSLGGLLGRVPPLVLGRAHIRTVLIGLGGIADAHVRKLQWMEGVEVAGVCDLSPSLTEAVAKRFGVPVAGVDAASVIAAAKADAVHILTPPGPHPALASIALDAGAHVFIEKPAAVSWEGYTAIRDAAAAADRLFVEDYNYRFQRAFLKGLEAIRAGAIGTPVTVDVAMNVGLADPSGPYADNDVVHFGHDLPGGALFNFVTHPASVIAAILGPADGVRTWHRRLEAQGRSDDELRAIVAAGDACATITVTSHAQPSSFTVAVRGTAGHAEIDIFGQRVFVSSASGRIGRLVDEVRHGGNVIAGALASTARIATARNDYVEGLGTLLEGFYAAVRGDAPTPLPIAEIDATNRLVFDLFEDGAQL